MQAIQTLGVDTVRVLFVTFLIGHTAVRGVMWTLPFSDAVNDMPFNPADSWLIGRRPTVAAAMAGTAAIEFVLAAGGFAARSSWWPELLAGPPQAQLVRSKVSNNCVAAPRRP
ncbi:MAG: hypothetical protein M9922_11725 [Microthrixaceae bacterium]|nr:hypothetical protein [Microthrixaceae bacterium]